MAGAEITGEMILWAIAGGFLPALFWLWFWLKEDAKKPEPKGLLALSFISGSLVVFLVIPVLRSIDNRFTGTALVIILATAEEIIKYLAICVVALRSKYFDEPVDAVIYAITVALGFAAMENFLYIVNIITESGTVTSVLNGNMRFIGATLLHTVSSATVGILIALSFFRSKIIKFISILIGLITASLLHTTFNLFIIKIQTLGDILTVFLYLWILVIILILLFEKIKRIHPKK